MKWSIAFVLGLLLAIHNNHVNAQYVEFIRTPQTPCIINGFFTGAVGNIISYSFNIFPKDNDGLDLFDVHSVHVDNGTVIGFPYGEFDGLRTIQVRWNDDAEDKGFITIRLKNINTLNGPIEGESSLTVYLNHQVPNTPTGFNYTLNRFENQDTASIFWGKDVEYRYSISKSHPFQPCTTSSFDGSYLNTTENSTLNLNNLISGPIFLSLGHAYRSKDIIFPPFGYCDIPDNTSNVSLETYPKCKIGTIHVSVYQLNISKLGGFPDQQGAQLKCTTAFPLNIQPQYQWYRDAVIIPGATQDSYLANLPGEYHVNVSILGGSLWNRQSANSNRVLVEPATQLYPSYPATVGQNLVIENTFLTPRRELPAAGVLHADEVAQSITYLDGLARPKQSVSVQNTPMRNDVVSFANYLEQPVQRQHLAYPVLGTSAQPGVMRVNPETEQANYYSAPSPAVAANPTPFVEARLDSTPFQRVLRAGAAAPEWQLNTNRVSSAVTKRYSGTPAIPTARWDFATNQVVFGPNYSAGSLLISESRDAQGTLVRTYTNMSGETVLKAVELEANTWAYTLEVSDDFGYLRLMVPPELYQTIASGAGFVGNPNLAAFLAEGAFHYRYDDQGQLTSKKVPNKAWEHVIYNRAGQIVAVQTALQSVPVNGTVGYGITKFDRAGRHILKGELRLEVSQTPEVLRAQLQVSTAPLSETRTVYNASQAAPNHPTVNHSGYTNLAWPTTNYVAEALFYYDDYDLNRDGTDDVAYRVLAGGVDSSRKYVSGAGTVTRWRMLGDTARTAAWKRDATFYDAHGRTIQQIDGGSGEPTTTLRLGWTGRVLDRRQHYLKGSTFQEALFEQYAYDHRGRLKRVETRDTVLLEHQYNELGQLIEKNYFSTDRQTFVQSVDYRYTAIGWLKSINQLTSNAETGRTAQTDLFAMELGYQEADPLAQPAGMPALAPRYDGRITWQRFREGLQGDHYAWHYGYDRAGRLTRAQALKHTFSSTNTYSGATIEGSGEWISYDAEGNIRTLLRSLGRQGQAPLVIDTLEYFYAGHSKQLTQLRDLSTNRLSNQGDYPFQPNTGSGFVQFQYDYAGNLTADHWRKHFARYNRLNLIEELYGPDSAFRSVYRYDGLGRLREERLTRPPLVGQTAVTVFERVYAQGLVIERPGQDAALALSQVRGTAGTRRNGVWQFAITDHLGNERVRFDQNGQVLERNHYYAYGLRHPGWSSPPLAASDARYAFAGGERTPDELDVQWQRNGARMYDPVLGRFLGVEPLADDYPDLGGYVYAFADPVNFNDPTGFDGDDGNPGFNEGVWELIKKAIEYANEHGSSHFRNNGDGTWSVYRVASNGETSGGVWASGVYFVPTGNYLQYSEETEITIGEWDVMRVNQNKPNHTGPRYTIQRVNWGDGTVNINKPSVRLVRGGRIRVFQENVTNWINNFDEPNTAFGFDLPHRGIDTRLERNTAFGYDETSNEVYAVSEATLEVQKELATAALTAPVYSVYLGRNAAGVIKYVGMTARKVAVRAKEHLRSAEKAGLFFDKLRSGLTKQQARILEQKWIDKYGMQKNGGQLLNKRNSVAPE